MIRVVISKPYGFPLRQPQRLTRFNRPSVIDYRILAAIARKIRIVPLDTGKSL